MRIPGIFFLFSVMTSELAGQSPSPRRVLWFGVGFGVGHLNVSCDDCPFEHAGLASHASLRGGLILSSHFLIGIDYDRTVSQRTTDAVSGFRLTAYYYPVRQQGVFFKAGYGTSLFDTNDPGGGDSEYRGHGAAIGAGYDLRMSQRISLTPTLTIFHGSQNQEHAGSLSETAVGFALGVTFH